jgi:hypothetical protein
MFVTDDVSNKGTDVSELQLLNMKFMSVTDDVSNKGTDVREEQPWNILPMFVTDDVSNKGTDVSEEQVANILFMSVTVMIVSEMTTFCKTRQILNKLAKLVIDPSWLSLTRSRYPCLTVVAVAPIVSAVQLGAAIAISSHPVE